MRYRGFASDGISITAGFDINTHICEDDECPIPVYPMNRLEEIIKAKDIQVAILTVPEQEASELFSRLSRAGIRGYLNFTPIGLKASKEDHDRPFIIHNVNIALELEQIFYELNISDTDLV